MSTVVADISMSLDGFVTGPDAKPGQGLGLGGEPIHQWVFESAQSPLDRQILAGSERVGAVVMGRNLFDVVDAPDGWTEEVSYGYDHTLPKRPHLFVVTHRAPERWRLPDVTFVTDGIVAAVDAARRHARDREVSVMGGAQIIDQALKTSVVDQLCIHLSPVLMGEGTRLFDLVDAPMQLTQAGATVTPNATHLTYLLG